MAMDEITNLVMNMGMNFNDPINIAINLFLSTLIGGIVLIFIIEIFGKKFKENVHPANAFLVVLIINIINILGVLGLISFFISFIPFLTAVLPILIWILLVKLFFKEMKFTHAVLAGIIGYFLSIFLVPMIVSFVSGFMPKF